MASGLSGQSFAFHGYLPVDEEARKAASASSSRIGPPFAHQLFIETPYRNDRMFEALRNTCSPETRLCIAATSCHRRRMDRHPADRRLEKTAAPNLGKRPGIPALAG